ncbi:hypothetical protein, unknown function [Leishmania braziliensis MHOM/BR/75/M2904]|uniref:Uncharacterized protein n=2 Tax=Leishmania braziliensis TaxID=5660 RepID=A4HGK7_LEIBR|nr:hypothetical protein, unknown function [Leishmania braziliensis MHOM/BR/75/M2904]CAJ2475887.1 unnamed protein product [Leishmania braziliensis]CAM39701.1 hypothetical protein, unknown function [Leishmania braziliensis MHOM/BR/75/M2904]SYZ67352.1 hypothetical_protein [Leishmania braziliensis MHOM/BR/75/M2904]
MLSKVMFTSAGPQPAFASLQNASSNSKMEVTDPLSMSSEATTTTVVTGGVAGRCPPCFTLYPTGADRVGALHDGDTDHLAPTASSPARGLDGVLSSASKTSKFGVAGQPSTPALPKRKYPKLLTQLAHELRWMHRNLRHRCDNPSKHRVNSVSDASQRPSSRSSDSPSPHADGEGNEELRVTTSLRSSMRSSSYLRSEMMSRGGSTSTRHAHGTARNAKQHSLTLAKGEAKQVHPAALPEVTPDPYAPPSCQYVVRHLEVVDAEEDALGSVRIDSPTDSVMGAEHAGGTYRAAGVLGTTYRGHGGSSYAAEFGRDDASDVEVGGAVTASPSDRQGLTVNGALAAQDIREGEQADDDAPASVDSYQVFFSRIVALQHQLHDLERQTARLRAVYEEEQQARLRSKSKGQHLSWTRTVEAANTIHFWRQKVSALRLFEAQYMNILKLFQQNLQLVDPETEKAQQLWRSSASAAAKPGATPVAMQARRTFLSSPQVIAVQEQHLKSLGEQMKACWKTNTMLREELRHFEQCEVRVPHVTFTTAGMDIEHFIASLPPRIAPCVLRSVPSHSSMRSLDSLGSAETQMLLTAQNFSLTSSDYDTDENTAKAANASRKVADASGRGGNECSHSSHPVTHPSLCPAAASASPLASYINLTSIVTSTPASPVIPKRLKYVIRSATLDHEESRGSSFKSCIAPLYMDSGTSTTNSQTRGHSERHVTFALEPEVLDARPRFSAHSRTVELLEQICLDKQALWSALPMLESALEEHLGQLAQLRAQWNAATAGEALTPMPRVTSRVCEIVAPSDAGPECYAHAEAAASSQKSFSSTTTPEIKTERSRRSSSKVNLEVCTKCSVM